MTVCLWAYPPDHSLEHTQLITSPTENILAGTVLLLSEGKPTQMNYRIVTDAAWQTRLVEVEQIHGGIRQQLTLRVSANQTWTLNGEPLTWANGLYDVDLEISPATNALPINRFKMPIGEDRDLTAVWVRFPALTVEPLPQRYTHNAEQGYIFHAPSLDNFKAQLSVDAQNLVVNYGDLWQRV